MKKKGENRKKHGSALEKLSTDGCGSLSFTTLCKQERVTKGSETRDNVDKNHLGALIASLM